MKKYSQIKEGHTYEYDLSNSKKLLEEAIERINMVKEEFSKLEYIDLSGLEEGWNLIDKYYGNVVRGEIFKRKKKRYIPNTSAFFPRKGDS
ncbi:MAG: hypothetical protein EBS19_06705 [Spirochaetia bacterium]|nr:hypothetical protein [Spirochaetia bacterium]